MKPTYFQFNCKEIDKLDLHQANAVLKHKPDIIVLEYPNNNKTPDLPFNQYSPLKKPKGMIKSRLKKFPDKVLKIHFLLKSQSPLQSKDSLISYL